MQIQQSLDEIRKNAEEALRESITVSSDFPLRSYFETLENSNFETFKIYQEYKSKFDEYLITAFSSPNKNTSEVLAALRNDFINKNKPKIEKEFSKFTDQYDGPDPSVKTRVQIGPLQFRHTVQSIEIVEPKQVEEFAVSRRGGSFLIPSGESRPTITISLTFPSLDAINNLLRPLIALFRVCPITVVNDGLINAALGVKTQTPRITSIIRSHLLEKSKRNKDLIDVSPDGNFATNALESFARTAGYLSSQARQRAEDILQKAGSKITNDIAERIASLFTTQAELSASLEKPSAEAEVTDDSILQLLDKAADSKGEQKAAYNGWIPVALTGLTLSTHPSIPDGIDVTLQMVRISVDSYMEGGIRWRDENGSSVLNPMKAFYLKSAMLKYLDKIPVLTTKDMIRNAGDSFQKNTVKLSSDIQRLATNERIILDFSDPKYRKSNIEGSVTRDESRVLHVKGMQGSLSHHFSFPVLIGKEYPTAQHIGTTNVNFGMYVCAESDAFIEDINAFKRRLDEILRSEFYEERVYGVNVVSPITKLLGADLFHFTNLRTNTDTNNPGLRHVNISMAENRFDILADQIITLRENTFNVNDVRAFWNKLWDLAEDGLKNIYPNGVTDDSWNTFINGLRKLRENGESSTENAEQYLQWKAIQILYGIAPIHAMGTTFASTSSSSQNSIFERSYVNSRVGILTTASILNALTNPYTDFPSKEYRRYYDEIYQHLRKKFNGVADLVQLINSYLDLAASKTLVGRTARNTFGDNTESTAKDFSEDHLQINALETAVEENDEDVFMRISRGLLFLSDAEFLTDIHSLPFYMMLQGIVPKQAFRDALFETIYFRPEPWEGFKTLVSRDTLTASRRLLLGEFENNGDLYFAQPNVSSTLKFSPRPQSTSVYDNSLQQFRSEVENCYIDFDLPTYWDLFGAAWPAFAPTWDEVGRLSPASKTAPLFDGFESNEVDIQELTFANASDKVPPSVFFYYDSERREKRFLRDNLKEFSAADTERHQKYYAGLDFDMKEVEGIGDVVSIRGSSDATLAGRIEAHLSQSDSSIRRQSAQLLGAVGNFLADHSISREDLEEIIKLSKDDNVGPEEFKKALFDPKTGFLREDRFIKGSDGENIHHGLMLGINYGGRLMPTYEKASEAMSSVFIRTGVQRFSDKFAEVMFNALDSGNTTGLSRITDDIEDMTSYRKFVVERGLSTIPDQRLNPIRAFPAFRFYLLDEEEKKFVYHDAFTGINAIQSIEVTRDKFDPDLAKITIADPLRIIQNQFFEDVNNEPDPVIIDPSLKRNKSKASIGSSKIKIGRPIQIRMGYAGHPDGLPTVFTGRITEIIPGDVIIIIAQGWKAECVAHEVSLKLNQNATWWQNSVKDLLAAAIRESDIKGLGEVYTPQEVENLRGMGLMKIGDPYDHAQQQGNTPLDLIELVNGDDVIGVDMRLKNIWVPDTPNALGYNLTHPLAWTKEWVVPMQPLWDVIQEASRHTMGYITDVVPYEGRGTIFFGRPDQPYFAREINPKNMAKWRKDAFRIQEEAFRVLHDRLFTRFFSSPEFQSNFDNFYPIGQGPEIDAVTGGGQGNANLNALRSILNGDINILDGPVGVIDTNPWFQNRRGYYYTPTPSYLGAFGILSGRGDVIDRVVAGQEPVREALGIGKQYRLDDLARDINSNNMAKPLALYNALPDLAYIKAKTSPEIMDVITGLMLNINTFHIRRYMPFVDEFYEQLLAPWGRPNDDGTIDGDNIDALKNRIGRLFGEDGLSLPLSTIGVGTGRVSDNELQTRRTAAVQDLQRTVERYIPGWLSSSRAIFVTTPVIVDTQDAIIFRTDGVQFDITENVVNASNSILNRTAAGKNAVKYSELNERDRAYVFTIDNGFTFYAMTGFEARKAIESKRKVLKDIDDNLNKRDFVNGKTEDPVSEETRELFRRQMRAKFATAGTESDSVTLQELDEKETIERFLDKQSVKIKLFIIFLAKFLRTSPDFNETEVARALRDISKTSMAPNMQVFRQYHFVTSDNDIISNDIVATTKQMANSIIIQHPQEISEENWNVNANGSSLPVFNTAPRYWPPKDLFGETGLTFSPGLSKDIKKTKVVSEMNVDNDDKAAMVAFSNMAQAMRPMYRGSLTILGRDIKPWDVILLRDTYTDMDGPIDVERVTHHFSPTAGWTTVITPHLVCQENPGSMILDIAENQAAWNVATNAADTAFNTIMIASLLPTAAAGLGIGAGALVGRTVGGIAKLSTRLMGISLGRGTGATTFGAVRSTVGSTRAAVGGVINNTKLITRRLSAFRLAGGKWLSRGLTGWMGLQATKMIAHGVHDISVMAQMSHAYGNRSGTRLAPVIYSPLRLHGRPFTAGVETSEALYSTVGWKNFMNYQNVTDAYGKILSATEFGPTPETVSEALRKQ